MKIQHSALYQKCHFQKAALKHYPGFYKSVHSLNFFISNILFFYPSGESKLAFSRCFLAKSSHSQTRQSNKSTAALVELKQLHSKTAIRTTAKRHFVDPSVSTAVLRTNPEDILKDFQYFGFLFEALCTRDIRVYAQANDGDDP
ncbi:MAG: DUF4143 domain-containing protein [Marinilabiliales bacterium]|nr:MAG: DUF4143 domain-containing protein [Marinilabiliales bacterium]